MPYEDFVAFMAYYELKEKERQEQEHKQRHQARTGSRGRR